MRGMGWFAAVAAVVAIVVVSVNSISTEGPGARGLERGERLPPFAVPLAVADIDCDSEPCDANVATRRGQDQAGSRPACEVRGPEILNVCELAERGPVVLAFLATRGGNCADALDRLEAARDRYPGVQFAAVSIRGDREDLRDLVRAHRWTFPVGWDRDGILANLYGVAVCPQITFARWRGQAETTTFGELDARELEAPLRRVVSASRRAGWRPPGR